MNLSVGIVGLPNVGKSTLFNALLKKQIANVANYPFCTIEPNIGVVEVPDERLPVLASIVKTEKIVPAVVEFYDIAGLVAGASKGEGLGNQFLAHIREVAVILQVVRLFEAGDVTHVANQIDPVGDIKTIETELILADLATLNKQREPRTNATKEEKIKFQIIEKLKSDLDQGHLAINVVNSDEAKLITDLNLLTLKPVVYIFNVSEAQLEKKTETEAKIKLALEEVGKPNDSWLLLCAKLENEVLALDEAEQKEFLAQYQLEETGLNRLIKKSYQLLGLISFLTAGVKEVRSWTIKKGTLAPQAAGAIHTDFIQKFIKAEIIAFADFVKYQGWAKARELGKTLLAGKDYEVKDGDVVDFKIGS